MPKYKVDVQPASVKKPLVEQPLRVAAYCRVSTDSEEQLGSLESQIRFYTNYIRKQPNWTLAGIYSDSASGVRLKKRNGYQQMMKDCKNGKINLILVKSISRFGRDTLTTIKDIRRLKNMNIGVYFEVGGFNTLTTNNSIIDQYATLAQAESQSHSVNVKFGMRRRMESCRVLLNHTQFLGYTKGEDGELKVVPEEAEIVRKIFELYIQGNGVRKIKKYFESHSIKTVTGKTEWSTSTIGRMLRNERYTGVYIYGDVRIEGGVPRIVSDELFWKVQGVLKTKKNAQGRHRMYGDYLLTGKLFAAGAKAPWWGSPAPVGPEISITTTSAKSAGQTRAVLKKT